MDPVKINFVSNLLLVLSGIVICVSFGIILAVGRIYPYPNYLVFSLSNVALLALFIFAAWQLIRERRGVLLFGAAGGLVFIYAVAPWVWILSGQPIDLFYGYESNLVVAIVELAIGLTMTTRGSFALFKKPARS